ncbi:MAG: thiamine pyrophosphate-dependent dehydrogenase E1 component subunit alpha [Candidatus Hodarchaeales archaeon]
MIQILDSSGKVNSELEPIIPEKKLVKMLEYMILVRLLDEKGMRLQRQGRISFSIPSTGQEATQIGAVAALKSDDWIFPAYREPGMAFYRGFPLIDLVNHWFANEKDPQKGRRLPGLFGSKEYRYVNPSAPIGTQIVQAAGAGFTHKYLAEKIVNIVFFGDGATSSSDFHSGLNFGAVFKTPTIFFCQNNHWAISVPISKQTGAASLVDKAKGYGLPGIQIDGNDILAVYHAVFKATERARSGKGPTFIEAVTYRAGPHTSSDDPTRYRPKQDLEKWKKLDPITRFEKYLISKNLLTSDQPEKIRSAFDEEINNLISKAEKIDPPSMDTLFSDVYSDLPWHLEEQLDEISSVQRVGK